MSNISRVTILTLAFLSTTVAAQQQTLNDTILDIGHRWAKVNYQTAAKKRDEGYLNVATYADQTATHFRDRAEPLIWEAIALAGAANAEGGLSGLAKARHARDLLLSAEKLNPAALSGSLYCTLGTLYAKVPSWPIGFGDKSKASAYLKQALKADPAGLNSNYFYADFLFDQGEYDEAFQYILVALVAAPRAGHEDSDEGRHDEAEHLLTAISDKLKK